MCCKGIVKTFENPKYVKLPNKGIASCALKVFFMMGVLQSQYI
jgi:hypothetical protein